MKHGALLKYNPFVKNWIRKNRRNAVATILQRQVFCWEEVEVSSDLDRLRRVLEALPDEDLVRVLEHRRGKGRDDFPVRACFNAVIAGIVFQHPSAESLLRELRRNAELRALCGRVLRDPAD